MMSHRYPVVALDHSAFITAVSCSSGKLHGTLSKSAFGYAQQQWSKVGRIVFVTSVSGCGVDASNDYFVANSIAFTSSTSKFTATGASAMLQSIVADYQLDWGHVGTTNVRRGADKSVVGPLLQPIC